MEMPSAEIENVTKSEVLATWDRVPTSQYLGSFVAERYFSKELEDVSLED